MRRFIFLMIRRKLNRSGNPTNVVRVWEIVPDFDSHPVFIGEEKGVPSNAGFSTAGEIVRLKFPELMYGPWRMGELMKHGKSIKGEI